MQTQRVVLDADERRLLLNVLNEVLHGFAVDNFDEVIGKGREEVLHLLTEVSEAGGDQKVVLNPDQTAIFRNALRTTLASLSAGDFPVRTGEDINIAESVLARLDQEIGGLPTPS
jgi:hypothetical protein